MKPKILFGTAGTPASAKTRSSAAGRHLQKQGAVRQEEEEKLVVEKLLREAVKNAKQERI